jgi:hypothetical protein
MAVISLFIPRKWCELMSGRPDRATRELRDWQSPASGKAFYLRLAIVQYRGDYRETFERFAKKNCGATSLAKLKFLRVSRWPFTAFKRCWIPVSLLCRREALAFHFRLIVLKIVLWSRRLKR